MDRVDGQSLSDVLSCRFSSNDLCDITGAISLQPVLDPCITGSSQSAVVDGFFMTFKPLQQGERTIVVQGPNTFGHDKTYHYSRPVE